jgi:hypothetical protein
VIEPPDKTLLELLLRFFLLEGAAVIFEFIDRRAPGLDFAPKR